MEKNIPQELEEYADQIERMRKKLKEKASRVRTRYKFYEMKNGYRDFGMDYPKSMKYWKPHLGWCAKAVDALGDRLQFKEFANDLFRLNRVFDANNPDVFFSSAIQSALIASCCFVHIQNAEADGEQPKLFVLSAADATGEIDESTGLLREGYAVLSRSKNNEPTREALFLPEKTIYFNKNEVIDEERTAALHPMLVPIIYRPDAVRPFGHSRISRACMDLLESAIRTVKRAEVTAEFYSFPQKYVTGLSETAIDGFDKNRATVSGMLAFTKDEDGDSPKIGQFTQQSMQPHTDQLKMFAALFAGETGLTLDDLGFATDNPSTAEAIKAAHENLRATARTAQKTFASGFLNVGYIAACVRDDHAYLRRQFVDTKAVWEPIFEPDAAAMAGIGDAAYKINQAVPGYFGQQNMEQFTGVPAEGTTDTEMIEEITEVIENG